MFSLTHRARKNLSCHSIFEQQNLSVVHFLLYFLCIRNVRHVYTSKHVFSRGFVLSQSHCTVNSYTVWSLTFWLHYTFSHIFVHRLENENCNKNLFTHFSSFKTFHSFFQTFSMAKCAGTFEFLINITT